MYEQKHSTIAIEAHRWFCRCGPCRKAMRRELRLRNMTRPCVVTAAPGREFTEYLAKLRKEREAR